MVEWISYTGAAALLAGLWPVLARIGTRRAAPAVSALMFALVAAAGAVAAALLSGASFDPSSLTFGSWGLLALSALGSGCCLMCLFRALAAESVVRVAPLYGLSSLITLGFSYLFFDARIGLWRLCYILLVLIGTVLMESGGEARARNPVWLLFAVLSAVFAALSDLAVRIGAPELPFSVTALIQTGGAGVFLLAAALAGGSFRTLRDMRPVSFVFAPLAGAVAGGAWVCRAYAEMFGDWSVLLPVGCASLAVTMLFARIAARERMSGAGVFGLVLATLGSFALLMGL